MQTHCASYISHPKTPELTIQKSGNEAFSQKDSG